MVTYTFPEKVAKSGTVSLKNPTTRNYRYAVEVYLWNPLTGTKVVTTGLMTAVTCNAGATISIGFTLTTPPGGQSDVSYQTFVAVTATPLAGGTATELTPAVDINPVIITVIPAATFNSVTWS